MSRGLVGEAQVLVNLGDAQQCRGEVRPREVVVDAGVERREPGQRLLVTTVGVQHLAAHVAIERLGVQG